VLALLPHEGLHLLGDAGVGDLIPGVPERADYVLLEWHGEEGE
jgi:hypothetical protein